MQISTRELTLAAVMSAFVFIATFVPKIPIPLGYAHLGDAAIFLVVAIFGRRVGIIAAILGSAMADLIGGFPIWIMPTIVIKWLMADIFARIANVDDVNQSYYSPRVLIALIVASLWMTLGYTLSGAFLYNSLEAGLTSMPGLLLKSLVNIPAFIAVGTAIKNLGGIRSAR